MEMVGPLGPAWMTSGAPRTGSDLGHTAATPLGRRENGHVDSELRTSARVVVVDDDGCALLVRVFDEQDNKPPYWVTAGGSVEPGESLSQTAARELREETGLAVDPDQLGRPLAVSRGEWVYRGRPGLWEDWYFGLRSPRFVPDIDGYTARERMVHETWSWWRLEELLSPSEIVIPAGLHTVVRMILEGTGNNQDPVALPWTSL